MSTLQVDRITPYQSASIQIDGDVIQANAATTGSNTFIGNQTINGVVTQNVTAPATDEFRNFIVASGATVSGKSYNQVAFILGDLPSFGTAYEDYFGIEYYDSLAYNFGSEVSLNGSQAQLITLASGSGQASSVRTIDNYDGTSQVRLFSPNQINLIGATKVTGSVEVSSVLQLAGQDPLPAGGVGQLAVSASNLYYHNGSTWSQIN